MTDQPDNAISGTAIQVRADARLRVRIRYLENELQGKNAIIASLNVELAAAKRQVNDEVADLRATVADANAALKSLEREREIAERNFNQLALALANVNNGEFDHLVKALQQSHLPHGVNAKRATQ